MEVFVDETLTEDKEIAFNASVHTDLIRIGIQWFWTVSKPKGGKSCSPLINATDKGWSIE